MDNKAPLDQMISEAETVNPLITDAMIQVGCGCVSAVISITAEGTEWTQQFIIV